MTMKISKSLTKFTLISILGILLAGCANNDKLYTDKKAEEIYKEAWESYQKGEYKKAGLTFDEVERQHPYSQLAPKSMMLSAYSYYLSREYSKALSALENFIQLHPGHPEVDYAYYLMGLTYYDQISMIYLDQTMTQEAAKAFETFMQRFPNSKYMSDVRLKLDLVRDHLAGKHVDIGRYYLNSGHYAAAIHRFQKVLENYKTASFVPEALYRMVEGYLALGIHDQAKKVAAVLGHNYASSHWYRHAYSLLASYGLVEGLKEVGEKLISLPEGDSSPRQTKS